MNIRTYSFIFYFVSVMVSALPPLFMYKTNFHKFSIYKKKREKKRKYHHPPYGSVSAFPPDSPSPQTTTLPIHTLSLSFSSLCVNYHLLKFSTFHAHNSLRARAIAERKEFLIDPRKRRKKHFSFFFLCCFAFAFLFLSFLWAQQNMNKVMILCSSLW